MPGARLRRSRTFVGGDRRLPRGSWQRQAETRFKRSSSDAITDDDEDAAMDCVGPKQQLFVLTWNCQVTGQHGGDTPVVSCGTF